MEKPALQLQVEFVRLAVHMRDGGQAMVVSAIQPESGGVTLSGGYINRSCCPGGGPWFSAQDAGPNTISGVSVRDVSVELAPGDNLGCRIQRGVSSFNDLKNTNNTRILVRKACILLYFIHGPTVFRFLGRGRGARPCSHRAAR